ncbi:uncharacterized protein LOC143452615 isoform X3 [Clavelina lepadiformis]|uniref:uncharacterized protein LOC143452615 isoform X3 n=1 Tax=Clavelina lepadiformis TaxID=159417 RepID=UPI00404153A9
MEVRYDYQIREGSSSSEDDSKEEQQVVDIEDVYEISHGVFYMGFICLLMWSLIQLVYQPTCKENLFENPTTTKAHGDIEGDQLYILDFFDITI